MSSLKIRENRGLVMMKTITYAFRHSDAEQKIELPARYEICERCRGEGHHSNPSIDGNGITSSEFAEWDEDEVEGYFSGRYDIACEERCDNGKALVVDEQRLTRFQRIIFKAWEQSEEDRRRMDADDRQTRFWENGGRFD